MDDVQAWPVQWPAGWPRTSAGDRERARFATPFAVARDGLISELRMMGVPKHQVVISSNVALRKDGFPYATRNSPEDPAVAVYFILDGRQRCIPCDRWTRVEDNLQAIRKTVEALRGLDRWGAKRMVDAAFDGFAALPEQIEAGWWTVIGVAKDATWTEVQSKYRYMASLYHPDVPGGSSAKFIMLTEAYNMARKEHRT